MVDSKTLIAPVASRAPRRGTNGPGGVPSAMAHPNPSELENGRFLRRIRLVGMEGIDSETVQALASSAVEVVISQDPLEWDPSKAD
ncbi:hypothetical protein BOTBODRAFT_273997 [Botryobasidium botryosum FD-172 SS1]|uniref:Uncharacterized protein n=1 Tax=Botryobasidium botryosum (strain FD-172 SS1) TaxID=930990 RepID=A0A067MJC6_BOTB1|nr:hypothetical protein BOTBODRAFT_273997 [Botryobasidium botryosum FD-172 SS1]